MMNNNSRLNGSGCKDPTAFEAVKHVSDHERKANDLIKILKYMIQKSEFELIGKIIIKDTRGREFQ